MAELHDELHQTYETAGGEVVPSVTQVIGDNLGWGADLLARWHGKMVKQNLDPIAIRDRAGQVGTVAHAMIERWLVERGAESSDPRGAQEVNPAEWPPSVVRSAEFAFGAFQDWFNFVKPTPLFTELRLTSPFYKFGGTLDCIMDINGRTALVDIKTSNTLKDGYVVQVAAYEYLLRTIKRIRPDDVVILWLGKHARVYEAVTVPEFKLEAGWKTFEALLVVEQARQVFTESVPAGYWRELNRDT